MYYYSLFTIENSKVAWLHYRTSKESSLEGVGMLLGGTLVTDEVLVSAHRGISRAGRVYEARKPKILCVILSRF